MRRLGVFAGGCTLEAAEAVCNAEGDLAIDLFDGVAALVEKSLLKQVASDGDESRFTMLVTIREFASEQLAVCGEADNLQRAHARFVLTFIRQAVQRAHGPDLQRVTAEMANIREALRWCVPSGEIGLGTRILWSLGWAAFQLGVSGEMGTWAERLLALPEAAAPSVSRARLLWVAGSRASADANRAQERARLEDSVAVSRAVGDTICLAQALRSVAALHMAQGDAAVAELLLAESLALYRGLGDQRGVVWALSFLGNAVLGRNDVEAARTLYDECLRLAQALGEPAMVQYGLVGHARLAERTGDRATARRLLEDARSLVDEVGENSLGIVARNQLARLWLDDGDVGRAVPLLVESLTLTRRTGLNGQLHNTLAQAARMALIRNDAINAARLLGASVAQRERVVAIGSELERDVVAQYTASVRTTLGDSTFTAAYEEGSALSLDEAIALALEQTTRDSVRSEAPSS